MSSVNNGSPNFKVLLLKKLRITYKIRKVMVVVTLEHKHTSITTQLKHSKIYNKSKK